MTTLPIDDASNAMQIRRLQTSVARNNYTSTSSVQNLTLNTATRDIRITVEVAPCYMKVGTGATTTDYDYILIEGTHDFSKNTATAISFIEKGSGSTVVVCEYA